MPTPPKPVPWDEVIEIREDLLAWLEKRGHVRMEGRKRTASEIAVALSMLGADPDDESPERRVGRALFNLERFHGHARDEDVPDNRAEQEADRSLRGLQPNMRHIQRWVRKSQEPALERMDQLDFEPEVKEQNKVKLAAEYDAWNERLELMIGALAELHEKFLVLCPSVSQRPQTLSGWQALKRELKASLEGVDIEWSC